MNKNKKESSNYDNGIDQKYDKKQKEILVSKIEAKSNQRLTLPQINPTTQKLKNKIDQFKKQQLTLTKTLQEAINGNLKYRSSSASDLSNYKQINILDKKLNTKQNSLINLKKNFSKRIQFNHEANMRLQKMQQDITLKKKEIARKLSLIQAQNSQKIKEIQQFEKSFLAQVKVQMAKNFEKQKRLKMEYEKISKQDTKIVKIKEQQNRLDEETWKQIMNLKMNLQGLMVNQKRRQNKLVQQKDVQTSNKQVKQVSQKEQQKKKEKKKRVKLDPKEAGRQYLDFAKKRSMATKPQEKLRKDYLDINLKVINYDTSILQVISNNDGYLSRNPDQQKPESRISEQKKANKQKIQKWNNNLQQIEANVLPILQQNNEDIYNDQFSEIDGIQQSEKD